MGSPNAGLPVTLPVELVLDAVVAVACQPGWRES
jgi:hypothetical protein